MDPFTVGIITVLLAMIFLSRSFYRIIDPRGTGRDGYAHLMYIRDIRSAGHRLPSQPSDVATTGKYGYPFFLHWVLSFLPGNNIRLVDKYFSGAVDVLFAAGIVLLVPFGFLTEWEYIVFLILFLSTPEFMTIMAHGIGISARKPGMFVVSGSLFSFYIWEISGSPVALMLSLILGVSVFLISKFGLQAYFFITIGLAILVDPYMLAIFLFSFLGAIIFSLGAYIRVLSGHLSHLASYALDIRFRKDLPSLTSIFSRSGSISLRQVLLSVHRNPLSAPLYNPFILPLLGLLWIGLTEPSTYIGSQFLIVWAFTGILAFLITSTPPLQFLGEGRRYLQYIFVPASILIVTNIRASEFIGMLTAIAIIVGLVTEMVFILVYRRFRINLDRQEAVDDVVKFLQALPKKTILVQPTHQAREFAYKTKHKYITFVMNYGSAPEEGEKLMSDRNKYVSGDIAYIRRNYSPDLYIFDMGRLPSDYPGLHPPALPPFYQNDEFAIYRNIK